MTSEQIDNLLIVREWGSNLGFNSEIEVSLIEYFGGDKVGRVEVNNSDDIYESLQKSILRYSPKRVYFDTRIFITDARIVPLFSNLVDCGRINQLFKASRVIPICFVTDPNQPGYCLVADLVTSYVGLMIPIAGDFSVKSNKGRLQLESMFNPMSIKTCERFLSKNTLFQYDLYVGGSSYEPRKSYFEKVLKGVEHLGLRIYSASKELNSYEDYLNTISKSRMVLNTNFVVNSLTKKHMVGRNIETFTCGSMLITQNTSTLQKYFKGGRDYISAEYASDAVREIEKYHFNESDRAKIALNGQLRAYWYAEEKYFVAKLDRELEKLK